MGADIAQVLVGRVSGLHGVRGWVKVFSYTEPRTNIVGYRPWFLRRDDVTTEFGLEDGRAQGKTIVAKLEGVDDRDVAAMWVGADILVARDALEPLEPEEYYWSDLIGLQVRTTNDEVLGVVDHLIETGANDVLVVDGDRRRLIPYVRTEVVRQIDTHAGVIVVDWHPDD